MASNSTPTRKSLFTPAAMAAAPAAQTVATFVVFDSTDGGGGSLPFVSMPRTNISTEPSWFRHG